MYLLSGLNVSILVSKSADCGVMFGKSLSQFCRVLFGSDFMYLMAF